MGDGTYRPRQIFGPSCFRHIGAALAISMLAGAPAGLAQVSGGVSGGLKLEDPKKPDMRDPMGQQDDFSSKVQVNEHDIVDLHVQDEDLATVLQMLSIQTQKNIITSKSVSATVTANLYGVTFYEALDAILHVNGYGYLENGNFISIYTYEELATLEKQNQARIVKVVHLNYLNAVDAAAFVEGLLSEGGQIKSSANAPDFSLPDNAPVGADDYALSSMLVINDFEENVTQIEALLSQLDSKPVQVLVEATILQTQLTEDNAFGIDASIIGSLDFADFSAGPLSAVGDLFAGTNGTSPVPPSGDNYGQAGTVSVGNTAGPAGVRYGLVSGDVAVFVRLLDEVSDTSIISRPNILTLNRQPARVLVGRKVGYLSTTSTDTATTQTVEFLDTGTQLYFRPFVSKDGEIRMELKPQVSEAVIREATDATGAAVTIPDEITNEIVTNVMVRDGQTIVLGGLFRESTQAQRRQVPFLGDLPIIGAAFRGHDDSSERSEILFMISPSIINDAELVEQGEIGKKKIAQVRAGFRAGLLPWSREKQSSQLVIEAQRLVREGNTQAALNKLQRALRLFPYQIDAIALREALMSDEKVWPSRRMMDDIVYGVMSDVMGDDHNDHSGDDDGDSVGFVMPLDKENPRASRAGSYGNRSSSLNTAPQVVPPSYESGNNGAARTDAGNPGYTPSNTGRSGGSSFNNQTGSTEGEFGAIANLTQEPSPTTSSVLSGEPTQAPEPKPTTIDLPTRSPAGSTPAPAAADRHDFVFDDKDIRVVLRQLADEYGKNLVFGPEIQGTVSTRLFDVTFDDALDAVLLAGGYTRVNRNSFIEIRPQAEAKVPVSRVTPQRGSNTAPSNAVASAPVPPAPSYRFDNAAGGEYWDGVFETLATNSIWGNVFWTGRVNQGGQSSDTPAGRDTMTNPSAFFTPSNTPNYDGN